MRACCVARCGGTPEAWEMIGDLNGYILVPRAAGELGEFLADASPGICSARPSRGGFTPCCRLRCSLRCALDTDEGNRDSGFNE